MKKRYRVLLTILGSILIFLAGGWTQEKFNHGANLFNQHRSDSPKNLLVERTRKT